MESVHFVRDLVFNVAFASEAEAFEQHNRLGSFVAERLTALADEVFTKVAPAGGAIVRIDRLEIDLGNLRAGSYYEEAERRFREKLEDAVRHKLAEFSGAAARTNGDRSEGIVSGVQAELDILMQFLESGYLPWNIRSLTRGTVEDLLRRALAGGAAQLAARLRSSARKTEAARRLAWQFPEDLRAQVAELLNDAPVAASETGPTDWEAVLEDLIRDDAEPGRRSEWNRWTKLFEQALVSGDAGPLRSFATELLAERPGIVASVTRRLGVRQAVRRAMARGFPDSLLCGIAGVVEPGEIGFVEEVTGRAEVFREAAKERRENWPETKARLWEFTFAYLLVERGGRFNKRSYLGSVVSRMAAHYNMAFGELLESLDEALARMEAPSALRREMLSLIGDLRRESGGTGAHPEPDETETWAQLLDDALTSGDSRPVDGIWREMARKRRDLVAGVVRRRGAHADVRRAMSQGLPLPMLCEIAEILEPGEIGFIEEVAERPELFAEVAESYRDNPPATRRLVWEFTFTYLLAERGGRFNRRSYLGSVIRQAAARANRDYRSVLGELTEVLEGIGLPGALRAEMLATLAALRSQDGAEAFQPEAPRDERGAETAWAEMLEEALLSGDARPMGAGWAEAVRRHRSEIGTIVRRVGRDEGVRRAMAHGFPLPTLRDIAEILEPGEIGFIEDVTGRPAEFRKAAALPASSVPALGRRLWEFTFTYLLVDRGGAFNRSSFLGSVLRRMAAHHNLRYGDLVVSLTAVLEELPESGQLKGELYSVLAGLGGPAADDRGLENMPEADVRERLLATLESKTGLSAAESELLEQLRGTESGEPGAADAIRCCELYDIGFGRLVRGEGGGSVDALSELRRDYPWQFARLLREAGGRIAWAGLSEEEVSFLGEAGRISPHFAAGGADAAESADAVGAEPEGAEPEEAEIEGLLLRAERLTQSELAGLIRALDRLLSQPPEWFSEALRTALDHAPRLGALAEALPERQLARVLLLTGAPGRHRLLTAADMIVNACGEAGIVTGAGRLKWAFLLEYALQRSGSGSEKDFAIEFTAWLARHSGSRGAADVRARVARSLRKETSSAGRAARRRILEVLDPEGGKPAKAPGPAVRPKTERAEPEGAHIYIHNAGQVLAGPYLPRLFQMTGLLEENKFRDEDAAIRGIHMLQYMVDGGSRPPEHLMPLNKILCGLGPDTPAQREIDLLQTEKDAVDGLLGAMIGHWTAIGKTSIAGLRETFLQREGRLRFAKGAWQLLVQPRTFDMLLDRVPWGFKVIRHQWMSTPVYVEWR